MQQIERYGVIALLLILVTVIAVTTWGSEALPTGDAEVAAAEGKDTKALERRTPKNTPGKRAREVGKRKDGPAALSRLDDGLPLTPTRPEDLVKKRNNVNAPAGVKKKEAMPPPSNRTKHRPAGAQARRGNDVMANVDERLNKFRTNVERDPLVDHLTHNVETKKPEVPADLVVERTPTQNTGTYVVKSGDTLSAIAQIELGSAKRWREIVAANPGVNPNKLYVGKKLTLPGTTTTTAEATGNSIRTASTTPRVNGSGTTAALGGKYVVKSGDMLSTIAQRELGSAARWREIAKLNPKVNPDRLYVGAVLTLPAGASPQPRRSAETPKLANARTTTGSKKKGRVR